ncbi:MAG: type II toxin-antitoxin system VapC family toxin [Chloroflexota bacterium]|nr:type II toxin-antitoxin system VapC family toxin [Chloroflexota bacterium]
MVADAGVLLSTVIPDPLSQQSAKLWQDWANNSIQVAAPTLFRYEIVSVIRKHVARGTITSVVGEQSLARLVRQPVSFYLDDQLLKRGYELASQFARPAAYDTQYLAVAEYLGCEFWTLDQRLFNVFSPVLKWVYWVGNV